LNYKTIPGALNTRLALFLSVVLHPLLQPTYLFAALFILTPELMGVSMLSTSARGSLVLLLFLNTFVAPALLIYYFYRMGFIHSLHLDTLRDRRFPYLATILIYTFSTYLFGWQLQPISDLAPQIAIVLGSITFSMAVVALVSLRWKISAHATGIGGCMGALGGIFLRFGDTTLFYPFVVGILVTGILLSARLHLNAHTPSQIGAGLGLGLLVSIAAIFLLF
jgi:membrane-associated phospholipid phosphatase